MYNIVDKYFTQPGIQTDMPTAVDVVHPSRQSFMPLDLDVLSPGYFLYLVTYGSLWYVIVETDYLSGLPRISKDIESSFPVVVEGWCVLKQHQKETGRDLLPPDSDNYDPDGTNDVNYNNHVRTIHSEYDLQYALAQVKPRPGVGVKKFGLSYFEGV